MGWKVGKWLTVSLLGLGLLYTVNVYFDLGVGRTGESTVTYVIQSGRETSSITTSTTINGKKEQFEYPTGGGRESYTYKVSKYPFEVHIYNVGFNPRPDAGVSQCAIYRDGHLVTSATQTSESARLMCLSVSF